MADLATVADLEARLGRSLDATETIRAEALLAGASARVRAYTGQQFEQATSSVRLRSRGGRIRFPQRPVTDVASITDVDGNAIDFDWYAGSVIGGLGVRVDWVDATYTHGYATIPDDVVEVVCQMVLRAFGSDPSASAITQESVEGYSYSIGAAGAAGAVGMLADEKAALDVYRRKGGTIRVGM